MKIWFDMDGTLVDFYGVESWLEKIRTHDVSPYRDAKPLLNMQALARILNRLIRNGHEVNIVSWLSKEPHKEFDKMVTEAKKKWLKTHLASVKFTHIDIIAHGVPKNEGREGILFDDEELNRKTWGENAYNVNDIINILKAI